MSAYVIDLSDLADLINFDDLGDELIKSGINITTKNSSHSSTSSNKDNDINTYDPTSLNLLSLSDLSNPYQNSKNPILDSSKHSKSPISGSSKDSKSPISDENICPVCYKNMSIKIKLPCGHEFCLGCIKAIVIAVHKSKQVKCPLCRQLLPDTLKYKIKNKPHLLSSLQIDDKQLNEIDVYWFYSGRDKGWWAYDIQYMADIEEIYQRYIRDEDIADINNLTICGMMFSFDFDNMSQINHNNRGLRRIKRVEKKNIDAFLKTGSIKGMAGVANQ